MKEVTKEQFYENLMNEKRDIIISTSYSSGDKFYPYTQEFKPRYEASLFGKIVSLGYINGVPESKYFLN